jgi:hypothetical protein
VDAQEPLAQRRRGADRCLELLVDPWLDLETVGDHVHLVIDLLVQL